MPKKETNKTEKNEKKHFFKDFKAELKRVIWPTPKQLVNNTIAVITIVLITALIVFVLDFAFESANRYGINNLKGVVERYQEEHKEPEDNENTNNNVEDSNTTEDSEQSNNEEANQETTDNTVDNNTEN